jgi:FkbM family methyltransferase
MRDDLIYDVGLFDGEDAAYYLFRGYTVVAIDANPVMIERARRRFAEEISAGRLTLLNVGVAREPGSLTFWVSDLPEWSSFDRAIASRDGTGHRAVEVPTRRFDQILAEHGVPMYLKVDIEGHDRLCIEGLSERALPRYVSVESECVGDSAVLSDEESLSMLGLLKEKGYSRFKLVAQHNLRSVSSTSRGGRLVSRVVYSAARGRLRVPVLAGVARRVIDPVRHAGVTYSFHVGSTGPWGEDIRGGWMTFEHARSVYLSERRAYFKGANSKAYGFWYDWHATR